MSFRLLLPAPLLQTIVDQARAELPNECCGLLAGVFEEDGKVGRVVKSYPLVNEAASPVEFWGEPKSQIAAHKEMDREGLEWLAVYHSHPTTAPIPSVKDRERSVGETIMALIVSLRGETPEIGAWWLTEETHARAEWEIERLPVAQPVAQPIRLPHPGFWWAVLWCVGFVVATQVPAAIMLAVIALSLASRRPGGMDLLKNPDFMKLPEFQSAIMPSLLTAQVLGILGAWLAIRLVIGRDWPRRLALRRPGGAHVLLAVAGLPGMFALASVIDALMRMLLQWLFHVDSLSRFDDIVASFTQWPWYLGVLVIGVGPGLAEELFCRGFLGRGLVGRYGVIGGALLTSMFFAVLHLEPRQVAYTFLMGLLLHGAYLATRSLWIPILLHTLNNSLAIVMLHLSNDVTDPIERLLTGGGWAALALVFLAGATLVTGVGYALWQSRARLAAPPGAPIEEPAFPGVMYPPPRSQTGVIHPWPSVGAWLAALGGVVGFIALLVLASFV